MGKDGRGNGWFCSLASGMRERQEMDVCTRVIYVTFAYGLLKSRVSISPRRSGRAVVGGRVNHRMRHDGWWCLEGVCLAGIKASGNGNVGSDEKPFYPRDPPSRTPNIKSANGEGFVQCYIHDGGKIDGGSRILRCATCSCSIPTLAEEGGKLSRAWTHRELLPRHQSEGDRPVWARVRHMMAEGEGDGVLRRPPEGHLQAWGQSPASQAGRMQQTDHRTSQRRTTWGDPLCRTGDRCRRRIHRGWRGWRAKSSSAEELSKQRRESRSRWDEKGPNI